MAAGMLGFQTRDVTVWPRNSPKRARAVATKKISGKKFKLNLCKILRFEISHFTG